MIDDKIQSSRNWKWFVRVTLVDMEDIEQNTMASFTLYQILSRSASTNRKLTGVSEFDDRGSILKRQKMYVLFIDSFSHGKSIFSLYYF